MSRPLRFIIEGFDPDWSVHPGQTIHDLLTERAWSQAEFAAMCGVSPKHMSRVITGKAGIGPDFALGLEAATHVSAGFWARLQAAHDVHVARQRITAPSPSAEAGGAE